ncbi:MAG: hypothetical protein U0237_08545 [Thermoleophilia bacterium]
MNEQTGTGPGQRPQQPPQLSQSGSWIVACVVIGWLLVYNALRLAGDTPAEAALPGLLIGGTAGLVVFIAGFVTVRRLVAAGRVVGRRPTVVGGSFDDQQRDALRIAAIAMLFAGAVALVTAVAEFIDYIGIDGDRPIGTIVLMAWNVIFAAWVADEALRVRRSLVDGIETVYFGCLLTAVLAGVGISRELVEPLQVFLALAAGVAGLTVGMSVWRLGGARGIPVAMLGALAVTVASLALPLAV